MYSLHSVEWDRLWEDYIAEYNPIWNVDGTIIETETRDLEANHTGTDTTAHTGTITNAKTGTDTHAKTGTESNQRDIDITDTINDSSTDTETGTDTHAKTGTETTANTGTQRTDKTIFGFDSSTGANSDGETRTDNLQSQTTYNTTDTETKNLSNGHSGQRTDRQLGDDDNTTTYNTTDTETLNLQDQQTMANSDATTKNLKDTDEGTITRETTRQGNIGVTMTQQMLQADKDYWTNITSLFYNTVIKDIVTELCYKISVGI